MLEIDREKLKTTAKAATGGSWSVEPHGWDPGGHQLYAGRDGQHHGLNLLHLSDGDQNFKPNIEYIAAAGPGVVLSLLRHIEELEEALKVQVKRSAAPPASEP